MAVVTLSDKYPSRAPSLRGAVVIYTHRGQTVVQKWPRKRGPAKTKRHKEQTRWFLQARKLSKYLTAQQQIIAREATAGTPLLPGDLLMSAMAGRLFSVEVLGGATYYPRRAMTDVSDSLDTISNVPGYTLVRDEHGWVGMPVAGGSTQWHFNGYPSPQAAGMSFSGHAHKGFYFEAFADAVIEGLMVYAPVQSGGTYLMSVARISPTYEILELTQSAGVVDSESQKRWRFFEISAELNAGGLYGILFGRTDSTDTWPTQVPYSQPVAFTFPSRTLGRVRAAKAQLALGDVLDGSVIQEGIPCGAQIIF